MEEAGFCASLKTLPLRAGCTAPPPTPVRRAEEPADAIAAHLHHHRPDDHLSRPCDGDVGDDGDADGSAPRIRHQSSSPPSRAELDELSRYLMQQLAAPLLSSPRRKPKASLPCGDEAAVDQSRNEEQKFQSSPLCSVEAATDRSRKEEQEFQSLLAGCGGLSVHTFCAEEGLFKDGKMGILRACEEEGAFYVQCTDISRASCSQIDSICKQCPAIDGIGVIGSYPLLSLSQLMTFDGSREPSGVSSHQQEDGSFESPFDFSSVIKDTSFAEAAIDFRNTVTVLQNLMFKISKELLKILLEEDQTNLQGHFIKPELHMCKHSGNEPAKCDKDVILSITSPGNASHQGYNERNMLLVVLGSYMQSWSKEKYKTPSLFSSVDLADAKICLRLDLVYHI